MAVSPPSLPFYPNLVSSVFGNILGGYSKFAEMLLNRMHISNVILLVRIYCPNPL